MFLTIIKIFRDWFIGCVSLPWLPKITVFPKSEPLRSRSPYRMRLKNFQQTIPPKSLKDISSRLAHRKSQNRKKVIFKAFHGIYCDSTRRRDHYIEDVQPAFLFFTI